MPALFFFSFFFLGGGFPDAHWVYRGKKMIFNFFVEQVFILLVKRPLRSELYWKQALAQLGSA